MVMPALVISRSLGMSRATLIPVEPPTDPAPTEPYASPVDLSDLEAVQAAWEAHIAGTPTLINVKTVYGAAGNGTSDDTAEINAAFADLENANAISHLNPILYFPTGTYRCNGTVLPKSGVNVLFQDANTKLETYGQVQQQISFVAVANAIYQNWRARNMVPVPLGQNPAHRLHNFDPNTHHLICLNWTNVRTNSWHMRIQGHHMLIDGYASLNADTEVHNVDDGMDLIGCHDIIVRNFNIHTNDDCFAFHNAGGLQTYNILIEDGDGVSDTSTGVAIGSQVWAGIHDILIRRMTITNARVPLYLKAYNENPPYAEAYNIVFHEIDIVDNSGLGHAAVFCHMDSGADRADTFHHFTFDTITYTGPSEFSMFYFRYARDCTFRNVVCNFKKVASDVTPGTNQNNDSLFRFDNCHGMHIEGENSIGGWQAGSGGGYAAGGGAEDYVIHLEDSWECTFEGTIEAVDNENPNANAFVRLEGALTVDNDFSGATLTNPDAITKVQTDGVAATGNQSWPGGWP